MTYRIEKIVVYWAESGDRKGWCYAVHTVDHEGVRDIDSATVTADSLESAVRYVNEKFPAAEVEIGEPDIV